MILEAQAMQDEVLGLRVKSAMLSNKLVRLENPMITDRIKALKRRADAVV
jgi:hypothetical protein